LSIGDSLFVTKGANVTSGTAGLTFGNTTLSADNAAFNVGYGVNLTLGALSGTHTFMSDGDGQLTLNTASTRISGAVTLVWGTTVLGSTSALGTTGVPLILKSSTLDLATDASVNAYSTTIPYYYGYCSTIYSDRATSGAGITHTLGTLSIGGDLLVTMVQTLPAAQRA